MPILLREHFGSQRDVKFYSVSPEANADNLSISKKSSESYFTFASVLNFFQSVFLPQGFPDSVSQDYIEYQIFDSLQAFVSCSSFCRINIISPL